jgi:peptidoglycan/LPS O-acetylase OafA/YrhL
MQIRRIPSLDGLRALAILMVIALHLSQRFSIPDLHTKSGAFVYVILGLSGDGVGIFFVLSGFLITSLLLREYDATGRIDFYDFYLRRTFRILPPLYAYLAFVVIFCAIIRYPLHLSTITGSALFYRNYYPADGQWLTEHTWSLCVEEQFYLLWPIALVWALNRGGKAAAARLAAVLIILAPVLRVATKTSHLHIFDHRIGYLLHARMDALMCGCLMALLVNTPKFEAFYVRIARFWWLLPLEFMIFSGVLTLSFGVSYRNSVGYTVDSVFVALFLVWAARNEHSWVGKILNSRVMSQIGVLSYSAYIWQTFFIHDGNPTWANHMPWAFALIWIAAALSYNLIEGPSLNLRKSLENRRKKRFPISADILP